MKLHITTESHSVRLTSIGVEIQFPETGAGARRNDELERFIEMLTAAKDARKRDLQGSHEATSVWFGVSDIISSHNADVHGPRP